MQNWKHNLWIVSTSGHTEKVYLGAAEKDFKKRYYNYISSFQNETQMNKTTLAKYVWEQEQRHNIIPYSNVTKSCMLWLHKKFEILTYPNQDKLLNKRPELVSKCCRINKYLLSNYKGNDWHSV